MRDFALSGSFLGQSGDLLGRSLGVSRWTFRAQPTGHPMSLRPSHILRRLVAGVLLAGCASPTGIEPLSISLSHPILRTTAEIQAWPHRPAVVGGEDLQVRGTAYTGCARAQATARRRGDVVGIEVTAIDTDRICPANVGPWVPFEATVSGLAPGTYRVRVAVAGHDAWTEATAAVVAP